MRVFCTNASVANVTNAAWSPAWSREVNACAAESTDVTGSGGLSPSLFILPERSIAKSTSVGTSQLRSVFAIGSGHVKTAVSLRRGPKLSMNVREDVRALPLESKIVAITSTSFAPISSLLYICASKRGRASAPVSSRDCTVNWSGPPSARTH